MKTTEDPVVVEQCFDAPIEKVWNAITDINEMKHWYFENIDAFKPVVGTKSKFKVSTGERTFTHLWKVTEVNVFRKIAYNWRYQEYSGNSFVSWELFDEGGKTKLVLTATVTEDFLDAIPEFKRESCLNGWKYFIADRLAGFLNR